MTNGAGTDKLAVFFRYDLYVNGAAYNHPPVLVDGVTGNGNPTEGNTYQYDVTASDPDGDTLTYAWTVKNKDTGSVIPGYNGISGNNGPNHLQLNFAGFPWNGAYNLTIDCLFTDGKSTPVPAVQKVVTLSVSGDVYVSNNAYWIGQNYLRTGPRASRSRASILRLHRH